MRRRAVVSFVVLTAAATEIVMAEDFYPAEPGQQNYHQNNPVHDGHHRGGCGRGARLNQRCGDQGGAVGMVRRLAAEAVHQIMLCAKVQPPA